MQGSARSVLFHLPTHPGAHWFVAARLPIDASPANLPVQPHVIIQSTDFTCLWRLAAPVSTAVAESIARDLGCRPAVGQTIPLPGTFYAAKPGAKAAQRVPVLLMRNKLSSQPPYQVEGRKLIAPALAIASEPEPDDFKPAGDVEMRAKPQLWPGLIPVTFALLAGEPKVGKSLIAADIAARVTTGAAWPDGAKGCAPGGVLFLETEDELSDTRARLEANGADLARILADDVARDFSDVAALRSLDRAASKLGGLRLIVISPLRVFFGDESPRQVETRKKIEPLLDWCTANECTLVGIGHKEAGKLGRSAEEIAGPKAIIQRARAALLAMRDPADPRTKKDPKAARRILTSSGTNSGKDTFALRYDTVPCRVAGVDTVRLVWGA
jgi:hypothetical protein